MKALSIATLAVVAALLGTRASAGAAGVAFTTLGVIAMLYADYGRKIEPLRVRADVVPIGDAEANPRGSREAA